MNVISEQHFRPSYHFTPRENWLNDPNGMVFFNGEYHLFFQHHPYGTFNGPMHWGHAISSDLVRWEEQQVALKPDELGVIFSGSAVVDWKDTTGFFDGKPGLVAIFTHHYHEPGTEHALQRQSLAYSADSGRTWVKYEGNPVLSDDRFIDFRDPKVIWHEETLKWVMILACGQTVCIYTSPNLKDWEFASEFGQNIGSHDGVWECPDLFQLSVDGDSSRTKWVMIVSIGSEPEFMEGSRTQYFTGEFDGRTFVHDEDSKRVRWLDSGRDNYAGVTWSDIPSEDGRRIFIGWMSNWKYAGLTPTEGWRGAMTTPRELTLESRNGEIKLIQRPVREFSTLRKPLLSLKDSTLADANARLAELALDSYELVCDIQTNESFSLRLRTSAEQETVVGYRPDLTELFVDRTRSGKTDFHKDFSGGNPIKLTTTSPNRVELRIYVDGSSLEVFASDGEAVFTNLIFPDSDAMGLGIVSEDHNAILHSLDIYLLS
ncbi:glycoside hydrolase family 32 protein [Candidatus Pristimantibacillus sp. PTI5]|uniref:glycoside hydrolase family 32 protein n=1 Tax=Candidatus Pristimantibacillus sp. PTI5 TaxID=3400422 RepID=UPI003B02684F